MKSEIQCKKYLIELLKYQEYIAKNFPIGYGEWRHITTKIEMLHWFLYDE